MSRHARSSVLNSSQGAPIPHSAHWITAHWLNGSLCSMGPI